MKYEYEILDKNSCYQGFFHLERYRLRHTLFAGGWSEPVVRELLQKGHAAAVLPYDPGKDSVVLVEQFRIGALENPGGAWLLELVAGFIEDGETAEDVVRREAMEESGCMVLDLLPICKYLVSPGGSSETIHLFCGRVEAPDTGGIHGIEEEGEDIRTHVMSLDEALRLLQQGRIDSASPIIALQWLQQHRAEVRARWCNAEASKG
jgi:ADP-ribose pyrophosphatase